MYASLLSVTFAMHTITLSTIVLETAFFLLMNFFTILMKYHEIRNIQLRSEANDQYLCSLNLFSCHDFHSL